MPFMGYSLEIHGIFTKMFFIVTVDTKAKIAKSLESLMCHLIDFSEQYTVVT